MQSIKKNILLFLCLAVVAWYLFDEFKTYTERVLFVVIIILLGFGMVLVKLICAEIFLDKLSFRSAISTNKFAILILAIAAIVCWLFAGFRLTAVLVLGLLLYAVLISIIFWIWFRVLKKKP